MTDVHFSWKQLDGIVNPYKSTTGVVTITPLRYSHEDNTLITDASVSKRVDGDYTFKLPPNSPGTFYQFKLAPNEGSTVIEYRLVPDGTSFEYVDLALVDSEANYVDDPSVPPWIAELEALKESGDFFVSKVEAALDVASNHSAKAEQYAANADASATAAEASAKKAFDQAADISAKVELAIDSAAKSEQEAVKAVDAANMLNADAKAFGDAVRSGTFKGDAGPANQLEILETKTVSPNTPASVSITGEAPNQRLSFAIPKGNDGNPGFSLTPDPNLEGFYIIRGGQMLIPDSDGLIPIGEIS